MKTSIKFAVIFVFILGFVYSNLLPQSIKNLHKTRSADIPEKDLPAVDSEKQNISVSNGAFIGSFSLIKP